MPVEPYTTNTAHQTKANSVAQNPIKIATIGGSITGARIRPNYVGFLAQLLGGGYTFVNKGIPADTAANMAVRFAADIVAESPREVIILAGINDINLLGATSAAIQSSLESMYDQAVAASITPRPALILPFGNYAGWNSTKETKRAEVNAWIKSQGLGYVDTDTALTDWTLLTQPILKTEYDDGDGLHPGPLGAAALARVMFEHAFNSGPVGQKAEGLI